MTGIRCRVPRDRLAAMREGGAEKWYGRRKAGSRPAGWIELQLSFPPARWRDAIPVPSPGRAGRNRPSVHLLYGIPRSPSSVIRREVKAGTLPYDGPSMRRTISTVVAGLLLVGCASATSSVADNGSAAVALRAAAEKTLAVDSFHVDATQQLPSGSGNGTVDYQAPDREHDRLGTGRWATETISIGDTVYFTDLNRPGYFWTFEGHGSGANLMLMYVSFLEHAENVRLDGHLYRFELPPYPDGPSKGSTSGVATLTDEGFINTLLYHWQLAGDEVSVGFTYSGYNSGITVEPPAPNLIVRQAPAVACPSSMLPPSGVLPNSGDFCDVIQPSP